MADPNFYLLIVSVLLVAGTVKGIFGIGLPAVAMSIFVFFIEPRLGVSILALPVLVSNIWQFSVGIDRMYTLRRYAVAFVVLFLTSFIVSQYISQVPADVVTGLVGITLMIFSVSSLYKARIPVTDGTGWQVLVGISAGVTGGISSVVGPVMMYLVALDLPRDRFVVAAGLLLGASGLGLSLGLIASSEWSIELLPFSLAALVSCLLGLKLGANIRKRFRTDNFRKLLLLLLLFIGFRLFIVGVVVPHIF